MQNFAAHHPLAPSAQRYYVVFRGTQQGIFTDWAAAAARVIGVTGAIHRRYGRLEDAQAALADFNMREAEAAQALVQEMQSLGLGGPGVPPVVSAPVSAPVAAPVSVAASAPVATPAPASTSANVQNIGGLWSSVTSNPAVTHTGVPLPAHASAPAQGATHHAISSTTGSDSDDRSIDDDQGASWFNVHSASTHAGSTGSGTDTGSVHPSSGTAGSTYGTGSTPAPSMASASSAASTLSVFAPLVPTLPVIHGLPSSGRRYYAVVRGRQTGIFDYPWNAVRALVRDYPGALYRPFRTLSEASHWFVEQTEDQDDST
ncbi:hypothetical protein BV25DRAFT_1921186 [Artomyces pyxidatus]|uniref:Uncharacterized protein n=1 Tax=Artomyces pyxidatus TaxID=48021 RepID=A0ACB8SIY1_9AGAM|nr:hypothetical protein BV25DRAFT_1921186 [Artomyces pyxidatus]